VQETQACPAGAQNTSNIVGASATANMLRELESQIAAEGEEGATNFWQQIHTIVMGEEAVQKIMLMVSVGRTLHSDTLSF